MLLAKASTAQIMLAWCAIKSSALPPCSGAAPSQATRARNSRASMSMARTTSTQTWAKPK